MIEVMLHRHVSKNVNLTVCCLEIVIYVLCENCKHVCLQQILFENEKVNISENIRINLL